MSFKNTIKSGLNFLHLDLTKNLAYDRLTKLILKSVLNKNSNCIDIGCHKGEILDLIIQQSPNGKHFAFEPLPFLYNHLNQKYKDKAQIYPYALSNKNGFSTFQYVKNAPAYSGLKKRKYDIKNPQIEEISVEMKALDELIPSSLKIDFIKIDVEGAEFNVLLGAKNLLIKNKPIVVFECGLGANDCYGSSPKDLFDFITGVIGLKISLLKSFLNHEKPITLKEFEHYFNSSREYYFIAYSG